MRSSKAFLWWGIGVVAVLALLAGCGSQDISAGDAEPSADDISVGIGLDGPVMRHREAFANEGEDAEVRGVLEIEGACLYIALDEIGERYPVVWPAATSWDRAAGRVVLASGESVGHGDSVYGGGGYYYVADVAAVAGEPAADLAAECVDNRYGEIAVVNNQPQGIAAGDRPVVDDEPRPDPAASGDLNGDWLVNELTVDGARIELDSGWPITVTIDGEMISGTAACNEYGGVIAWSAEAGFGRFAVSDLSWTEMGCEAAAMTIEQAFLTALKAVDSYEAADGLYVSDSRAATNFHLVRPGSGG